MGAKRLRKQYEKPRRLWDKQRIESESKLREEYGLKNAKELWKMQTLLRKIRREARRLLSARGKDVERRKEQLIKRMKGFLIRKETPTLDDVLSLTVRDVLDRRLQTIAHKKHFAKTIKQSRQFISHGHLTVKGKRISSPSYLVKYVEEDEINWHGHKINVEPVPKPEDEPLTPDISDVKQLEKTAA
ncbi:30S ribosomal protein S4 [Candidatus Micrarchaeota archaeon]|nr:30S ribosomal protein S4 [Candidatus Micrarchaeota archaeon]